MRWKRQSDDSTAFTATAKTSTKSRLSQDLYLLNIGTINMQQLRTMKTPFRYRKSVEEKSYFVDGKENQIEVVIE